jgi:hypothetical protein
MPFNQSLITDIPLRKEEPSIIHFNGKVFRMRVNHVSIENQSYSVSSICLNESKIIVEGYLCKEDMETLINARPSNQPKIEDVELLD